VDWNTTKDPLVSLPHFNGCGSSLNFGGLSHASRRRKLIEHVIPITQIRKVAGFADTSPIEGSPPDDPVNRRITLLLKVNSDTPK